MSERRRKRLPPFREIGSRRDLVIHVATVTLFVILAADLIDFVVNLMVGADALLRSFIQTTLIAALMSTIFIGGLARANLELFRARERLEALSRADPQTGLLNRRYFFEEVEKRRSASGPACLLVADIDNFKQINDTFGHPAGDAVIGGIANILSLCFPPPHATGRLGGEEFAALLCGSDIADARGAAEALRRLVAAQNYSAGERPLRATLSIGIAPLRPDEAVDDAYHRADQALYRAKRGGRDRIEIDEAAPCRPACEIVPIGGATAGENNKAAGRR